MTNPAPAKKNGQKTLYFMFALFFLPFLAATLAYTFRDALTFTSKNYGQLVTPHHDLQEIGLTDLQGNVIPSSTFAGKWWLILIAPKNCPDCKHQVEKMDSVFYALNHLSPRLKRMVLNTQPDDIFIPSNHEVTTYVLNADNTSAFAKELNQYTQSQLFIVDPLGNFVMRYPASAQGNGILRDLLQLLKVSRIG